MGLFTRLKDWDDGDTLYEADLEAEFDNLYDSIVAATTSVVGMVQLEDSHASTSVVKAACPKNVKEAYDLAGTMVTKATFDANTMLMAATDNVPVAFVVGSSCLVGRKVTGAIQDLAPTDVHTILNIADGATKYPDTGEQAFLDADHTKLNGIETSATADQTKTDIDGLGLSHDSLSDVSANDHHAQSHNAASHSDITSTGTNIDSAVSLKHAATLIGTKTIDETDIGNTKVIAYNSVSGNLEYESAGTPDAHASSHQNGGADEISVTGLSGLLADDQHVLDAEVKAAAVSDAAYAAGWDGVTDTAPSKNAVYDKIETIGSAAISDAVYSMAWNGVTGTAPSKNAVYDKIETIGSASVSNLAYSVAWDGITNIAPSKNVVYDKIETLVSKSLFDANTFLYAVTDNTPVVKTRAEVMDLLSGEVAADFAMNTHKITGVVDPTAAQDVATKNYVDVNAGSVSDAVYGVGWNGVTGIAPSKNAVYDKIETMGGGGAPDAHKNSHDPADGSDPLDTAVAAEISAVVAAGAGVAHSFARSDHIHAIVHAITDNHLITVDGTTNQPVSGDYGKFTTLGLEGMSKTQMLSDLNVENGADVTDLTNVNAAGAVMESDYNANTFLYAVSDDTPVVKTRAETLALLSGQASASFDMNSQAITKLSNIVTTHTPDAAGTATLDLDVSRIHDITMPAGNITIAISNENNGNIFTIRILQDGTGSRTVTWFSTIKWAGGSAPTLTTTANKADTVIFRVTGTDTYDGFVVGKNV